MQKLHTHWDNRANPLFAARSPEAINQKIFEAEDLKPKRYRGDLEIINPGPTRPEVID